MPRWRTTSDVDGGTYVLSSDLDLPEDRRVVFHFRAPLPSEVARIEQSAGHVEIVGARAPARRKGGRRSEAAAIEGGTQRWVSGAQAASIQALLLLLTDVTGPGPDGSPLRWPAQGTDADKERVLSLFAQADLYEVAEAIVEGSAGLSEDERKNSVPPPS